MPPRQRLSTICTSFEDEARAAGYRWIAGLDEVGRGALAGPVVAAAVILDPERPLPEGLDDSKKLTAVQRGRIAGELRATALAFAIGQIEPEEIDRINIFQATCRAMLAALERLTPSAEFLLIDALRLKQCSLPQQPIIRGDSISASIAAASVIAKTYRDDLMRQQHDIYPEYQFASHVGYATRKHLDALQRHGASPIHRRTFHGVLPDAETLF
jgi:ribonuclease HII